MFEDNPEAVFDHHQWCVFYDRMTGEVVHIHEYLAGDSSDELTQDQLREQAVAGSEAGLESERIGVLHPPEEMRFEPTAVYGVDQVERNLLVVGRVIAPPLPGAGDRKILDPTSRRR